MSAVFIAGTGTDVGKTFVAAALLKYLRANGVPAAALKPVASGYDPRAPAASDAGVLLAAMGVAIDEAAIASISPFRFAAPLAPDMAARREGVILRLEDVVAFCRARVASAAAPLLIEGVGGIMSPVAEGATGLDLLRALGCPALLVAGSYLGTISHVLTAIEAAARAGVAIQAVVVNETSGAGATLEETCAALGQFARGTPVIAMPRHAAARGGSLEEVARVCGFTREGRA